MFVVVVTRPLLRQIENLQSTFAAQTSSYERVEQNLTDRLSIHLSLVSMFVIIFENFILEVLFYFCNLFKSVW